MRNWNGTAMSSLTAPNPLSVPSQFTRKGPCLECAPSTPDRSSTISRLSLCGLGCPTSGDSPSTSAFPARLLSSGDGGCCGSSSSHGSTVTKLTGVGTKGCCASPVTKGQTSLFGIPSSSVGAEWPPPSSFFNGAKRSLRAAAPLAAPRRARRQLEPARSVAGELTVKSDGFKAGEKLNVWTNHGDSSVLAASLSAARAVLTPEASFSPALQTMPSSSFGLTVRDNWAQPASKGPVSIRPGTIFSADVGPEELALAPSRGVAEDVLASLPQSSPVIGKVETVSGGVLFPRPAFPGVSKPSIGKLGKGVETRPSSAALATFQEKEEVDRIFDYELLRLIVQRSRLRPDDSFADVWWGAWSSRTNADKLGHAVPPGAAALRAMVHFSRLDYSIPLLTLLDLAGAGPAKVMSPLGQRVIAGKIDRVLLRFIVDNARAQADEDANAVYARALESRSGLWPWPIEPPSRELVGFVVVAAREHRREKYDAVLNHALAGLLFRKLGGKEQALSVVDGLIEYAMLEALLLEAQRERKAVAAADSFVPAALVDKIWERAVARRAARWELPWPPAPLPDRSLTGWLIVAGVAFPEGVLNGELALALANLPLRRQTPEQLARVQQAQTSPPSEEMPADRGGTLPIPPQVVLAASPIAIATIGYCYYSLKHGDDEYQRSKGGATCTNILRRTGTEILIENPELCLGAAVVPEPTYASVCLLLNGENLGDALAALWHGLGDAWDWFGELWESEPLEEDRPDPNEQVPVGPDMPVPDVPDEGTGGGGTAPKPIPPRDKPDYNFGLVLPGSKPLDTRKPAEATKPRPGQTRPDKSTPYDRLSVTERAFFERLCSGFNTVGRGFQAADLLLVMMSETNGKLDPTDGSTSGVMGINQLQLSELQKVRKGMTRKEYTSLSRAEQIVIILDWLNFYLDGKNGQPPITGTVSPDWTLTQRAALIYAMNTQWPGSGWIQSALNSGTFPAGKVLGNLSASDVLANKPLDKNGDGVISLGDLETALRQRRQTPAWREWCKALASLCKAPVVCVSDNPY